jgi:putative hemolysin
VGDVTEHDQSEYQIIQRDENSWLVDGIFPIIEFVKYFNLELGQLDNNFVTVAGLFINQSDSLPQVGDTINIEDLQLEIIDKDAQRIDKILVTKI